MRMERAAQEMPKAIRRFINRAQRTVATSMERLTKRNYMDNKINSTIAWLCSSQDVKAYVWQSSGILLGLADRKLRKYTKL
jgi:hypothetical protein